MRQRIHGDPRRDYAKEWRQWREARSWTQKELASVLGLGKRTVEYIENGHHPPSVTSREKMAELQKRHREAQA
jgi:transcriptional regulator with XRE-family HTH domain